MGGGLVGVSGRGLVGGGVSGGSVGSELVWVSGRC